MLTLVTAVVAIGIAGVCCWRVIVGAVASRPISDRLHYVLGQTAAPHPRDFSGADFAMLERLFTAAGALHTTRRGAFPVRAYYGTVHRIARILPSLAPWAEREMKICSRYLATRIERLLATNTAYSRRARSL